MIKRIFFLVLLLLNFYVLPAISSPAVIIPVTSKSTSPTEPDSTTIKNAVEEFKNLSKKERKERIRNVKKEIKEYKATIKKTGKSAPEKFWLDIIAILLPPLAIYLYEGEIRKCFWISLSAVLLSLLSLPFSLLAAFLLWLLGVIYSLVIINQKK